MPEKTDGSSPSLWHLLVVASGVVLFYALMVLGGRGPSATRADPADKARPTVAGLLGIDAVESRLGAEAPIGRGVTVGHVEGDPGDYAPRSSGPEFGGVTFRLRTGPSKVNGHAQITSQVIYGPSGLAPGVSEVHFFDVADWLTDQFLRTGSGGPPAGGDERVFTNSWIGHDQRYATDILRRIDYLADTRDVVMVVGVNNGADTTVPPLLASAYNVIAVGEWRGNSSGGYTQVEGAGRCKPDIVGPLGKTSFSTPAVAAVVARLLEAGDRMKTSRSAASFEVIKAVLLNGADKPADWQPQPGKPLDEHYGAGRVRFDHSYAMLTAGAAGPGAVSQPAGWNDDTLARDDRHVYAFDLLHSMGEASFTLVWNRRVDGRVNKDAATGRQVWNNAARLADFDLRLAVTDDQGRSTILGRSVSDVDNVEHLHFGHLAAGRYVLQVSRKDGLAESWSYAVAWRLAEPTAVP